MRLYQGDVVWIALGPETVRGVVREVCGQRARVQIGADWTWLFTEELHWEGDSLVKLPRTDRGWRKLGRVLTFPTQAQLLRLGRQAGLVSQSEGVLAGLCGPS